MPTIREIEVKYRFKKVDCHVRNKLIKGTADVGAIFDYLKHETKEHFIVANLTKQHRINSFEVVAIGRVDSVGLRTAEVLRAAIITNMPTILLVHNHPSGNSKPSKADYRITEKIVNAAKQFDIEVLDHVVIGKDEYTSIKTNNGFIFN